jgi:aminomethyltransferase
MTELRRSPLDAVHRRRKAKLGAFAGWDMPIEYQGTLAEHRAVREAVGVFDLSHLGKVEVRDGTIVDDLIVYREADGYLLVPNAANWPLVADAVRASAGPHTEVTPRPDVAVVAVQGPRAPELVGGLFAEAGGLDYMHMAPIAYGGQPARLCRTGYTGERGFELLVPGEVAPRLWEELLDRGAALGAVPVGLGARDTLRLEMGYALHGNDISTATDPFEARLGWAVALGKGEFRGRQALLDRKQAGPSRLLVGLRSTDRLIPRHGMAVLDGERRVGEVTSGTFSPTLRHGIALAYVAADLAAKGTELQVDVRGRRGVVQVTRPPFVQASPK